MMLTGTAYVVMVMRRLMCVCIGLYLAKMF